MDPKPTPEQKPEPTPQAMPPVTPGTKTVEVICGPYRGKRLQMSDADAEAAINSHWAIDPAEPPHDHEPLDDKQRADALEASEAWAKGQWGVSEPKDEPKPEAAPPHRAAAPEHTGTEYETKPMQPTPAPASAPKSTRR